MRSRLLDNILSLDSITLSSSKTARYLVVIFDQDFSIIPHINRFLGLLSFFNYFNTFFASQSNFLDFWNLKSHKTISTYVMECMDVFLRVFPTPRHCCYQIMSFFTIKCPPDGLMHESHPLKQLARDKNYINKKTQNQQKSICQQLTAGTPHPHLRRLTDGD